MKTLQLVNGDLQIGPGGYVMIEGSDKVIQDLGVMVREAMGVDRFHPRWGSILDDFIGLPIGPETHMRVRSEIYRVIQNYIVMQTRAIEMDMNAGRKPRYRPEEIVVDVADVKIQQFYDRLNVKVTIQTSDGETHTILRTVT